MATSSSPVEIAVIGSARISAGDPRYDDAVRLGGALATEGWTVMTGGYGGLMGAVASGATAHGGHTVGLPMRAWEHLEPDANHAELRWSDVIAKAGGMMHDNTSTTIDAAIRKHGGAATVVGNYTALNSTDSANLLAFLGSL